jgi:hypothetical protein
MFGKVLETPQTEKQELPMLVYMKCLYLLTSSFAELRSIRALPTLSQSSLLTVIERRSDGFGANILA